MQFRKKIISGRPGFTLPEVMVSISVLTMVIFSATQLVVSIIRTNTDNLDTLIGYGLAQEGLEGMRNIRDGNWLLGASFGGSLGEGIDAIWGAPLPKAEGETSFYTIDLLQMVPQRGMMKNPNLVAANAPWRLNALPSEPGVGADSTLLYRFENSGDIRYAHNLGGNPLEATSKFHRYIRVENVPEPAVGAGGEAGVAGVPSIYKVSSVVTWQESGREKEVRLVTELTDWNQGQL